VQEKIKDCGDIGHLFLGVYMPITIPEIITHIGFLHTRKFAVFND